MTSNKMSSYRIVTGTILILLHTVGSVPWVPFEDDAAPVVHTSVGSIRGLRATDGDYSMFLGIPYAEVDKDNPFGASEPYPIFEETFDAMDDSAICPQIEEFNQTVTGALDCLHLNIYVPTSASTENPLPVMVVIYGGLWRLGFAGRFLYGPSYLVRHDVILVTLNYRVGPYGFMCLDIPEVPGNQGLKDQLIALRWINENIAAFGGDDSRITVGGNSAGGMSSDLHLYYGQEQLFHRIILQSGVSLVHSAVRDSDPTTALELAEYFNYTPANLNDALIFLATKDSHEIITVSNEIGLVFRPCVEKSFDNVEQFISQHPVNVDLARAYETDVLIGYNNNELYAVYSLMNNENLARLDVIGNALNDNFVFGDENELFEDMKKVVSNFYFGDNDITGESIQSMADAASDFNFNHPVLRTVKKYLDNGVQNLYLYLFSYSGGRNFVKLRQNVTGSGASHADEIGYLFDISYMEKPLDPEDELIVDRMTELWTNFVKFGDPTPGATELVPIRWPQVTHDKWYYLEIDTDLRISTRPMHHRMAFLDLFYKVNEEKQRGLQRASSAGRNIVLDISLPLLFAVQYFV